MKIAVSSICRGHMFSLASRLSQSGHLAQLYCGYPRFKMRRENIPHNLICNFPWVHTPYMASLRYGSIPQCLDRFLQRLDRASYENFVTKNLVEADVFHGLSNHNLKPGLLAKQRGASYICDRGSSHIVYQDKILREEGERTGIYVEPVDQMVVETELAEYSAADRIFVPSLFARRTFMEAGIPQEKIWSLPYGVNLENWHPVPVQTDGKFRVVFLGSVSMRKGIHDLLAAFQKAGLPDSELVLVGKLNEESRQILRFYRHLPNLILTGILKSERLLEWLSRSSVFVLPSIEDGFGLVIMEAMACGLPVIATTNTGGPDIIEEGRNGFTVPIRSPDAIAEKLVHLHSNPEQLRAMRAEARRQVEKSKGWETYARGMLQLYETLNDGTSGRLLKTKAG